MEQLLNNTLKAIGQVNTIKPTFTFWINSRIGKLISGLRCPDNNEALELVSSNFTAEGSESIFKLGEQKYRVTVTPIK